MMNNDVGSGSGMEAVKREAEKIAKKIRFKIIMVDGENNRAAGSVGDIPDMPVGSSLKIKTFANLVSNKSADNRPDNMNI
jgi:hypothetical protein